MRNLAKSLIIATIAVLGFVGVSNALRDPVTPDRVKQVCRYPYSNSGYLTTERRGEVSKALSQGYRVGHDREYPDWSVDFWVK